MDDDVTAVGLGQGAGAPLLTRWEAGPTAAAQPGGSQGGHDLAGGHVADGGGQSLEGAGCHCGVEIRRVGATRATRAGRATRAARGQQQVRPLLRRRQEVRGRHATVFLARERLHAAALVSVTSGWGLPSSVTSGEAAPGR